MLNIPAFYSVFWPGSKHWWLINGCNLSGVPIKMYKKNQNLTDFFKFSIMKLKIQSRRKEKYCAVTKIFIYLYDIYNTKRWNRSNLYFHCYFHQHLTGLHWTAINNNLHSELKHIITSPTLFIPQAIVLISKYPYKDIYHHIR